MTDDMKQNAATIRLGRDGLWLAREHWPEFAPSRYASLVADGRLDEEASKTERAIEERTEAIAREFVTSGRRYDTGRGAGRELALDDLVYAFDETDGEGGPAVDETDLDDDDEIFDEVVDGQVWPDDDDD